jgi:DNA-binding MarR family transcriptional regulator
MGGAGAAGMHAISFQLKRAHLQAVAFGRVAVAKVGRMTPARFDLMYALRQPNLRDERDNRHFQGPVRFEPLMAGVFQSELTRVLGLARSTVSRMLKRLEELGWITRMRIGLEDGRSKYVRLTKEGLRRIWRAMRRVFRGRIALESYELMFKRLFPRQHPLVSLDAKWCTINSIARHFGDTSKLRYDFGAEEY